MSVEPPGAADRQLVGTYRLQIRSGFTFDDAAATGDYLAALGVSHAYLSPILQAAPGSEHGYDVVDHATLSREAGGRPAFDRLVAALHDRGVGAVADVVPNHMALPTPAYLNTALWSVLRDGPYSPSAHWFDVDWSVPDRAVLMAVLGQRIGEVLAAGELSVDHDGVPDADIDGPVLRYYDHVFPLRPGTEDLPLAQLVDRQWYRLAHWRVADEELNYRRFFDVDTLAAVRVEDPAVFAATHDLLLSLVRDGSLDGLRIDHPDGLADPRDYLRRLRQGTTTGGLWAGTPEGAWVVVEKILEGHEELPDDWPCAGTTGYDALLRIGGLFVDPAGAEPLSALWNDISGDATDFPTIVEQAKREVVQQGLYAEVLRLVDLLVSICQDDIALRDHTRRGLHDCVAELLVAFDRYRAYVVPGEPAPAESVAAVEHAATRAKQTLPPDRHDTVDAVVSLVLGRALDPEHPAVRSPRRDELIVRFQQTCGPVMAKGVEDTAFYRWFRLSALNEVGGDPERFGVPTEEFHAWAARQAEHWPRAMTTLSTHDTKRSEDVRARLAVLSEVPGDWGAELRRWREAASEYREPVLDGGTEYLIWQTLVGTWPVDGEGPIGAERLLPYLQKAVREAKRATTWTAPDEEYEHAVAAFATGVLNDRDLTAQLAAFVRWTAPAARCAVLGQKLVQLVMPGVPDVYQGSELVDLSLVDPDNRRDVDYAERRARLAALDGGSAPRDLHDEKLLVVSRALRLRRARPDCFTSRSTYAPVATTTGHAVAFERCGQVVAVATRLPVALERLGGWGGHQIVMPEGDGPWRDLLTGRRLDGGPVPLADVLDRLPVALLVRG